MIQAVASETGGPIVVIFTFVRSSAAKRSLSTFGGFLILAAVMLSSLNGLAETDYYRHAFFDNSIAPDTHYYRGGQAVLPSTVESIEGQLPVETHIFLSPPNALRLKWRSMPGGSWDAEVRVVDLPRWEARNDLSSSSLLCREQVFAIMACRKC